ncbi:LPS translocon maturation chaperone LptM [Bradyrhizobium sp. SYSU BS000235]|uniref:LPS translocon maturation chaperone LptM n=1 Tax=Bradyrhizobium sp. SYSU BS000235 TaxID=3411332 RepID=UPI003C772D5B
MTPRSNRRFSKLTVAGLIALTCILAGCGRKAGLDLPPAAAAGQTAAPEEHSAKLPGDVFTSPGTEPAPTAARGNKKRIFLDPILD